MLVATDDLHPMGTCRTSSVGSGYRTSPANCDDPIRGSGPGEIVFRHMSVVQRGVRSRATTAGRCGLDRLGIGILSCTACDGMCSVDRLGRLVRPCSASKSRRGCPAWCPIPCHHSWKMRSPNLIPVGSKPYSSWFRVRCV